MRASRRGEIALSIGTDGVSQERQHAAVKTRAVDRSVGRDLVRAMKLGVGESLRHQVEKESGVEVL
jgi:hypothetical protein